MELKKIAVGIDFSDESNLAARYAVDIARHCGAEVVLVHAGTVLDESKSVSPTGAVYEWEAAVKAQLRDDRAALEDLRERLSGQGVDVSHMVIDGFPDTGLCDAAKQIDADMIITGTHGRTGIKRFVMGSVAERVVRLFSGSVMVARAGGNAAGGFHKLLVPTDFSPHAERALQLALVLAAKDATIDLYHAWQVPAVATELAGPIVADLESDSQAAGDKLVDKYAGAGPALTFTTEQMGAAPGVQKRLDDGSYDVVVMGSHGRRGLRRFILGSVAEQTVRHAPCSVVVVHGDDD